MPCTGGWPGWLTSNLKEDAIICTFVWFRNRHSHAKIYHSAPFGFIFRSIPLLFTAGQDVARNNPGRERQGRHPDRQHRLLVANGSAGICQSHSQNGRPPGPFHRNHNQRVPFVNRQSSIVNFAKLSRHSRHRRNRRHPERKFNFY